MDLAKYASELRTSDREISESIGWFHEHGAGRVVQHVQQGEIDSNIKERQRKLESCAPEDLKKLQGEIAGLRLAAGIITLKQ